MGFQLYMRLRLVIGVTESHESIVVIIGLFTIIILEFPVHSVNDGMEFD